MLTLTFIALLAAQEADPCRACDVLAAMASALSDNQAARFMDNLDKKTPGYGDIEANVNALAEQDDILCSIDLLREAATDERVEAEADWYMQLRSKSEAGPLERRRLTVKIIVEKHKGAWKVVSIAPLSIFDPVKAP